MKNIFVAVLAGVAFVTIAGGVPAAWDVGEDDVMPSSVEIMRRHCSCAEHHHECGCCMAIKTHAFHKRIEANVCMNASYTPSPLGAQFFLTWNKDVLFNQTITAADPPPICFGIPHVPVAKACVKFSNVSVERHHVGGCAALEFKFFHSRKDIPLGCFFFRGAEEDGFDVETFLDAESLLSLLEESFQASTENHIDTDYTPTNEVKPNDDVTDLVTFDKGGCVCEKTPPQCDCCIKVKLIHFPVKACVHADIDKAETGFDIAVVINHFNVFKKHISVADPQPICKTLKIFHVEAKVCLRLTHVSLAPGHTGACLEVEINALKKAVGCFYMARKTTMT